MPPQIQDPIIKLYFDLIASNTKAFRTYYYGDPVRIPQSNLPALIGTRSATDVQTGSVLAGSSEDEHYMKLSFIVVADIRTTFSDDPTKVPGWGTLFDLVEGRDPNTLLLKPESLLAIIRHNTAIANNVWTDVKSRTSINYGVRDNRQPGAWSLEGVLTTISTLVQTR